MNPELHTPQSSPENAPANYNLGGEFGQGITSPERAGEQSREQLQNNPADRGGQAAPPPILPMPVPQPQVVPMPALPQPVSDDNPVIAADDDLIEKEWVDKAKKIIAETRDDPYKREREVSRLQADYLRKRYGREIGISN